MVAIGEIEIHNEPRFAGKTVYHVHVVHGMLVERPLPYEIAHTLIKARDRSPEP